LVANRNRAYLGIIKPAPLDSASLLVATLGTENPILMQTSHSEFQLQAADGACETHAFHPEKAGEWPAILMYMDGIGMRPALWRIAERIAAEGYFVLLPDLFYRVGFRAADAKAVFTDPEIRADLLTRVMPSASPANVMRDSDAFLAYIDSQPNVRHGKFAVTGYCMGGRLAIYAAGHYSDRVAAGASYHGGGLATDSPDSPHKLASQMAARLYIAGAMEDASFDDAQKERLRQALLDGGVDFELETYNARHGWVPDDTLSYDPAAAERHYETLGQLLKTTFVE
jgi:carboxymethylenebutenolidase